MSTMLGFPATDRQPSEPIEGASLVPGGQTLTLTILEELTNPLGRSSAGKETTSQRVTTSCQRKGPAPAVVKLKGPVNLPGRPCRGRQAQSPPASSCQPAWPGPKT
ncbi:UNVERIFIED_CONTAM: hypothetical protein FKN15_048137 [Acipenser sinensis]